MTNLSDYLIAAFTGFVSGFLVSIPVGPIKVIYCTIAFAGFTHLFDSRVVKATMELVSFLLMLFLGVKYLIAHSLPATTRSVESFEHRLHPQTAFWTGFVRCLGNPGVLLFWITISATFISHDWMDDTWQSKGTCLLGVTLGCFSWFTLLSSLVSRGRGRFSTGTLVRMSQFSGASLLIVSLVMGGRLVKLLAHR